MSCLTFQRRIITANVSSIARAVGSRSLHVSSTRLSDRDGQDPQMRKKESAHETEYVKREEQRVLREIFLRNERANDPNQAKTTTALKALLKKNGAPDNKQSLIDDLLKWRTDHH